MVTGCNGGGMCWCCCATARASCCSACPCPCPGCCTSITLPSCSALRWLATRDIMPLSPPPALMWLPMRDRHPGPSPPLDMLPARDITRLSVRPRLTWLLSLEGALLSVALLAALLPSLCRCSCAASCSIVAGEPGWMPAAAAAAASMYAAACGEPGALHMPGMACPLGEEDSWPCRPSLLATDTLRLAAEVCKLRASMSEGALRELATYSAVLPSDMARPGSAPA